MSMWFVQKKMSMWCLVFTITYPLRCTHANDERKLVKEHYFYIQKHTFFRENIAHPLKKLTGLGHTRMSKNR